MNHLSRKKKLYGAGSKQPTVKPAVLSPPKIGDFQFGASFSYIETLDLISDGPIEGLVDTKGNVLSDANISRGVYLDGTAVSVATEDDQNPEVENNSADLNKFSVSVSSFQNLQQQDEGGASVLELITKQKTSRSGLGTFFAKVRWINLVDGIDPLLAYRRNLAFSTRNYSNDSGGDYFEFNEESKSKRYELLFPNASTVADSDFAVGFIRDNSIGFNKNVDKGTITGFARIADYFFAEKYSDVSYKRKESGASFFQKILDSWNSYGPNENGVVQNQFMRTLIKTKMDRAFGSDWQNSSAIDLYRKFFHKSWRSGYMAIYFPDRDLLNGLSGDIQFSNAQDVSFIPSDSADKDSKLFNNSNYIDLLMPVCNSDGELQKSQDLIGGVFIFVKNNYSLFDPPSAGDTPYTKEGKFDISSIIDDLKLVTKLNLTQKVRSTAFSSKYNYNNVLIESRNGEEAQEPFRFFNKVHIDKSVNKNVYGPFKSLGQVQRIKRNTTDKKDTLSMDDVGYNGPDGFITLENGLPTNEGSNDNQRIGADKDYSSWNAANNQYLLEEKASPVTYVVHNPNVSEVFVTLQINSLFDTVEQQYGKTDSDFKVGDKLPAIMNVEIEVGKILSDGSVQPTLTKTYRISALVEGATLLDIGNPSNTDSPEQFKHVRDFQNLSGNADLATPFPLPRINKYSSNNVYSSPEKRYVKVSKLSTETFSVLISKDLNFYKVTEIIPVNLTYPFSAIIGTKIDSKSFSSTPQRSFDARLKKIQIPNNYYPTDEDSYKKDRRYYDRKSELEIASADRKAIYKGDWDGSFKEGWTDNPAWILYDLLTNNRYGLGNYVEAGDINKWELYKIGRFCDAVDSDGNFVGVPDGRGGLEPRYSCNIMFKSDEKVFDSIQLISKLFRGHTFFRASEVSFSDERVKTPIATFNNNNIKDGVFNYSNLRRDQQFNTVEVSYLDRFENFVPKVEVIEDEEDIRSRGVFKKRIDGTGVTSRAMARRIGQHLIYRTIKENQRVAFTSGLEALLCQPGDLIIVDDDLKNEKSNFGKVLDVDIDNQYIRLSGPYETGSMTGILTVYSPTGESSIEDLDAIAGTKRQRTTSFSITDSFEVAFDSYTGQYKFSGYTSGYAGDLQESDLYSEYALYTGTGSNLLYFNASYTGWTFATSLNEADRDYVTETTGTQTLTQLSTASVVNYDSLQADKRGNTTTGDLSGYFSGDLNSLGTKGILESEISLNSQSQIVTLTANTVGPVSGFGSFVSGVDAPEYLQFIKLGSPYRFDLQNADDVLYKIDSIKENSPNEYLVSAAKFETGKFNLIEENISIDRRENTFDYNVATQIGDVTYSGLSAPQNLSLTTGAGTLTDTFYISGSWDAVASASSYEAVLRYPSTTSVTSGVSEEFVVFDNLSTVGNYSLSVKAVGDSSTSNKTLDSEYSTVRSFILYEDLEEFEKSFTKLITFR